MYPPRYRHHIEFLTIPHLRRKLLRLRRSRFLPLAFALRARLAGNLCAGNGCQPLRLLGHFTILIGISGQMFERLVSVSSTYYYASTSDLSTGFSSRSLRNLILRGGFALRCLQRLSRPNVATRLCPWQNNRYTIGSSIPVLSY